MTPRVLRHLVTTRWLEVGVLQASPLLGAYLGRADLGVRLALMLLGSLALTAHVFVFNDWAGYGTDVQDPRRASLLGIRREQIGRVALVLLVVAAVLLAAAGTAPLLLGAGIAGLSVLYSCSSFLGKTTPVAASANHLAGGSLHFLLGYGVTHAIDGRGIAISVFFGLVFAAGHLNQEVRDHDADGANGLRTSAVVFGCRRCFAGSFALFTVAYLLIAGLAAGGVLPRVLLVAGAAWVLHCAWSLRALRRGLGYESALWMQTRYRLLFAVIGVAMLIR